MYSITYSKNLVQQSYRVSTSFEALNLTVNQCMLTMHVETVSAINLGDLAIACMLNAIVTNSRLQTFLLHNSRDIDFFFLGGKVV